MDRIELPGLTEATVFRSSLAMRWIWVLAPIWVVGIGGWTRWMEIDRARLHDPTVAGLWDLSRLPATVLTVVIVSWVAARGCQRRIVADAAGLSVRTWTTTKVPWDRIIDIHQVEGTSRVAVLSTDGYHVLPVCWPSSARSELLDVIRARWIERRSEPWTPPDQDAFVPDRDRWGRPVLRPPLRPASMMAICLTGLGAQLVFRADAALLLLLLGGLASEVLWLRRRRVVVDGADLIVCRFGLARRVPRATVTGLEERSRGSGRFLNLRTAGRTVRLPIGTSLEGYSNNSQYYRQWAWLHDEILAGPTDQVDADPLRPAHGRAGPRPCPTT